MPALGYGGFLYTLVIFIVSVLNRGNISTPRMWSVLLEFFALWVVLPMLALLLGALPFLKRHAASGSNLIAQ